MTHNNILEQRMIAYLVFIPILKFTELKKESKIIVTLIQRKDLDLEEKMQKGSGFGLIRMLKILIALKLMKLTRMALLFYPMSKS